MNFNAQPESMWLPPRHIERRATFDGSAPFAVVRRLSISRLRRSLATWLQNHALGAGSFTEGARSRPLERVWRAIAEPAAATRAGNFPASRGPEFRRQVSERVADVVNPKVGKSQSPSATQPLNGLPAENLSHA